MGDTNKINKRQLQILEFIRKSGNANNQEIKNYLEKDFGDISRITIIRDINSLLKKRSIVKSGKGRNVRYEGLIKGPILAYFDVEEYFKKGPDERKLAFERFNFGIFDQFKEIFTEEELENLKMLNDDYQKRVQKLPPAIIKKEFERLTVELSWKSSQIEGNTYYLIDTEILIKENKEAEGHKKEEATMILNHKKALDYITENRNEFKDLTLRKIEDVHGLIIDGLSVAKGLIKKVVGITGTKYRPLDNEYQIREMMEKTVYVANKKLDDPFSKAIFTTLMISYIQPFEDGNKRASRLLENAILLANNASP